MEGVGALADFDVVLQTPVWGSRQGMGGRAKLRVCALHSFNDGAEEADGHLPGVTQPGGEVSARQNHRLDPNATESEQKNLL